MIEHRERHGDAVIINWGKFGQYEMAVRPDGSLEGHAAGKPANWRRATFLRAFSPEEQVMQNGNIHPTFT